MDGSRAQALAYKGFAISARKSGLPFVVYRPSGAGNPLVGANVVATLPALMSADDYRMKRPNGYAKPTWTAIVGGAQTRPGDYLVELDPLPGATVRTFAIIAQQPLLPVLTFDCNATVSVFRPTPQSGEGVLPDGGNEEAVDVPLLTHWPCSLLQGTKGEKADSGIQGDTRTPWMSLLLPPSALTAVLHTNDNVRDDRGRRFVVSGVEASDLGYRLTVAYGGA